MRRLQVFIALVALGFAAAGAPHASPAAAQDSQSEVTPGPAAASAARSLAQRLEALEGKRRALVIFAPNRGNAQFGRQRQIAQGHAADFAEHRIVVIEAAAKGRLADRLGLAEIRRRFEVSPDDFAVVLLDLSGDVLLRSGEPVSAERLVGALPPPE